MSAIVDCCGEGLENGIRGLTYSSVLPYPRINMDCGGFGVSQHVNTENRIFFILQPEMPRKPTRIHARIDTKPWRRVKHGFARAFLNLFDPWQVVGAASGCDKTRDING